MGGAVAADRAWALSALAAARVARLGTVGPRGDVRLVPVCCARDGDRVVAAVDHKPKATTALARLDDMRRTGRATLLVDHYDDEDWSTLWWVRVAGPAIVHTPDDAATARSVAILGEKYGQYRQTPPAGPVYSIGIETLTWWTATP